MYQTIPEVLRKASIENLFSTNTFQSSWTTWKPIIRTIIGDSFSENDLINLGDRLSDIFRSTGTIGREQGDLSAGGTAWESLVCWYINLCTVGSRVVALKKMSLVPKPIQDAITVNYGNFACNTESDITVIVFPRLTEYLTEIETLKVINNNGQLIPPFLKGKYNPSLMNFLVERDFHQTEIGIIQCKTNWNDNAQIPMLWDMIYSAGGFRGRNITIGRNNFSIQSAQDFSYSFVTVPSNQKAVYGSETVAVKRVTNLSGGNYWGKTTEQNIAKSLKEIFTNNFATGSNTTLRNDLRAAIPDLIRGDLGYFRL